jgi:hypothetical protein
MTLSFVRPAPRPLPIPRVVEHVIDLAKSDGSAVDSELTGELGRVGQAVRVAFYFHFLDQRKPLNTSYGPVTVPAIEPMPTRLARLVPYEPVT